MRALKPAPPFFMTDSLLQDAPSAAALPEWFTKAKASATSAFEALPMPTRRDEFWRFSNLKALDPQDFTPARPVASEVCEELLASSSGIKASAGRLVFANDQLLARNTDAELAKTGVLWMPLSEALHSHSELLSRYFMRTESVLGSAKFQALHRSSVKEGSFLYVPKGVSVSAPLEAFHWLAGSGQAVFPHTIIVAEEGSSVTMVDWFKSASEARNMACGVNDLHVGAGAEVRYVCIQDWSRQTVSLHANATTVAERGSATHLGLHLGGLFSRIESLSRLNGAGARSDMLAATVADSAQEFDQRTLQDHRSPETYSDLLYKNALYDQAKTIVSGLIRVEPQAHKTDAFQKVRNLILSPDAEANSLPGLEILADDVRCSHGATTGEIDAEELFYMQSRGIPARDAYRLITFGFLNEVLERFPDQTVRERLQETLRARLHGH
ncbi:MAG: Fe-S cluster assembly protein SufD [Verrucomicrobia bacterium]|nr:MAG: Fe-S cluster assembly protein SufD [Verrucomicrobiota bacterium]